MVFGMLKTVLKNYFSGFATRQYPFKDLREDVDGYRGEVILHEEKCTFCMACQRVCPTACITVDRPGRTFELVTGQCVLCDECVTSCRFGALSMNKHWKAPTTSRPVIFYKDPNPAPVKEKSKEDSDK